MTEPDRFQPTSLTTITVEIDEAAKVAVVTLDRPEAYNAFSPTMQEELKSTWRAFRSDDRVNAIVLTAAGDMSFCVGIDRNEAEFTNMAGDSRLYGTSNNFMYDDPGDDLGPKSCDLWKPVICAVNGMACGGAFYMLAESDIIIAADHATFFDPHVTYGMAAVYEPMKMLQYMPLGEVLRMTLLGNHERMSAATAHRIGLVSEVCPADELMERARWVANAIASQPAVGVQASLRSIWAANDLGTKQALLMGPSLLTTGFDMTGMEEGNAAFSSGKRIDPRTR
ncbi:MAG: enoyl-CoA hydratase/isomerase family protein [Actinomycetota bacterium]|nr:enoyl-CoA hydratase/isomerase family protein [Actinomycetota bacterium]MEC7966954.1 enoyl-CoA hydratase/isomerase family protein [Actinomycetota bacterium]